MPIYTTAEDPPIPPSAEAASPFAAYLATHIDDFERRTRVLDRIDKLMRLWPPGWESGHGLVHDLETNVRTAIVQATGLEVETILWATPRDMERVPGWMTAGQHDPGPWFKMALERAVRYSFDHHFRERFMSLKPGGLLEAREDLGSPFVDTYHGARLPHDPSWSHAYISRAHVAIWYAALHVRGLTLEAATLEPLLDVFEEVAPISHSACDYKTWIVQIQ